MSTRKVNQKSNGKTIVLSAAVLTATAMFVKKKIAQKKEEKKPKSKTIETDLLKILPAYRASRQKSAV